MISLKMQERLRGPLLGFTKLLHKIRLANAWYQITGPINRYLIWQSPYFKEFKPTLVIDIGANTGEFIMNTKSAYQDVTILAFEPHPVAVASIKAAHRNDPHVIIQPVGLGSAAGTATLYMPSFSPSSSVFKPEGDSQEVIIPIKQLDDFTNYIHTDSRVFIKIDVEGYELEVLKGAKNFLSKAHYLYLETRTTDVIGCSFDEIYQYMNSIGWQYLGAYDSLFSARGELIYFDALFRRSDAK